MGVVVGVLLDQPLPAVVQEVGECGVPVGAEGDLVVLAPHDHPHQGDVDVERRVQGVGDVGHVFALAVDLVQVLAVVLVLPVVDDDDELHVA